MEMEDATRKRPRSASPIPSMGRLKSSTGLPSGETLAQRLKEPSLRNGAFNDLLKITSSHEINYSLDGDHILSALAEIFFETLGWRKPFKIDQPYFSSHNAWNTHATNEAKKWAVCCHKKLAKDRLASEELKLLEAIMSILRNLSFVAANLRLLAYSSEILHVLVGALYESASNNTAGNGDESAAGNSTCPIALPALHVLVNLAPYLDVTGQKLFCDKLFLQNSATDESPQVPNPSTFGQAADGSWGFGSLWLAKRLDTKEDVVQDVSKDMLLQLTEEYLVSVWSIFPALTKVFSDPTSPRLVIMMAMDLLQEFINHARVGVVGGVQERDAEIPDARNILVNIPASVLQRLTDLLCIPRLGSDSLDYVDPVKNIVTRVTTLKLLMGYDATVDTDVRDRALDVLVPLLELDSPRLARQLGVKENGRSRNRLCDAIVPILATQVGRNEAPLLASQLLRELSKAEENRLVLRYLQGRIVSLASIDSRVAHLAFNHMYGQEDE